MDYFRILLFITSFLLINLHVVAQKQTTIYAEFLGNGYAWGTVNMDYRIGKKDSGLGVRAGFSFGESADFLGMLNYLIGAKKHKIELGVGILNFSDRDKLQLISSDISKGIKPTGNISYRYHANNGLMLKIGWTPFKIDPNEKLYRWAGVGVGWKIF